MTVSIELPLDIEDELRKTIGDLDRAAKEAMLVELFRQHRLSHHQLTRALALTRYQVDGVLKRHNVVEDLLAPEEFEQQLENPIRGSP